MGVFSYEEGSCSRGVGIMWERNGEGFEGGEGSVPGENLFSCELKEDGFVVKGFSGVG